MSSYYDSQVDLQNVGPGKVAILKVSYNATFDKIHLLLAGGLTKADITQIEGKINGIQFYLDDAAKLAIRDAYLGNFSDATIVTIDFTEPNSRGGAPAQYLASLPRNLMQSLTFEITIAGTANALSTMTAEAEYRDPTQNMFVLRRKKFTQALSVTGDNDLFLPVDVSGGLIKRVWIHHTGHVTKAELRANGTPKIRALDTSLQYAEKRNKNTPQANLTVLDFIGDGNLMNMLNTLNVKECLLRITTNAADTATIYVDYVDDLRKLH